VGGTTVDTDACHSPKSKWMKRGESRGDKHCRFYR
jgi:hypothetical protein